MKNKTTGSLAHILGLLVGVIGPLILYFVSEDEFAKHHAKESVKWQLVMTGGILLTIFALPIAIGFFLTFLILGINTALPIIGAIKASEGEKWTYPIISNSVESESSEDIDRLKQQYHDGKLSDTEYNEKVDEILGQQDEKNKEMSKN